MKKEKLRTFFLILKDRISGAEIGSTSVLIAYYLLLSLFPLAIAIGNLLPLLRLDPQTVIDLLDIVIPEPIASTLEPAIFDILTKGNAGLLSVGVLGAIWSSSRGITHIQKGMNNAYGIKDRSNYLAKRLVSLLTILLILLLLVAFVLVYSMGEALLLGIAPVFPWAEGIAGLLRDLKWPVMLVFLLCLLALIYRVTPDVKLRVRDVLPGAALATAGLLVLVQLFTLYVQYATRTLSSYGTLGVFVLLMLWVHFSAIIILTGAILNATISEYRFGKATVDYGNMDRWLDRMWLRLTEWAKARLQRRKQK